MNRKPIIIVEQDNLYISVKKKDNLYIMVFCIRIAVVEIHTDVFVIQALDMTKNSCMKSMFGAGLSKRYLLDHGDAHYISAIYNTIDYMHIICSCLCSLD
jgi:hypothetical protein